MPAHDLLHWLQASGWHYCLRLPSDVLLHGARRYPTAVAKLYPKVGEAMFYAEVRRGKFPPPTLRRHVGLWQDGHHRCNLVLASPKGVKEPWAVITDESPTLQTLWQYALRFRVEELFLDSKSGGQANLDKTGQPFLSGWLAEQICRVVEGCPVLSGFFQGAFELADSRLRCGSALERLYLVAAIALLYGTTQGMAVQIAGLRQQVDPLEKFAGITGQPCTTRHALCSNRSVKVGCPVLSGINCPPLAARAELSQNWAAVAMAE